MERRRFANIMMALTAGSAIAPYELKGKATEKQSRQPIPHNLEKLIKNALNTDYKTLNTDHDGAFVIEGLLRFADRGYPEAVELAANWFHYHLEHDKNLTDEEYYKQYQGSKSRILRNGPLTFCIYSANLALAFPIYELYKIKKDPVAKQVCFDVADAVLHYAARDQFGMLAHDDINFTNFSIPDGMYFGIRACAIAATLSRGDLADIYFSQAIYQLSQGIRYFLDREKQLARIGMIKGEPSKRHWSRSQGWLMWCIAGLLRYLPQSHQKFKEFSETLAFLVDGAAKYQSKSGGFHVMVDDPTTPEEVSGMAMVLAAVKEGVRKRWIPDRYAAFCERGWNFIQQSVDDTGIVKNVYNGWAMPAEQGKTDLMDRGPRGFINGIMIMAIDEMTRQ